MAGFQFIRGGEGGASGFLELGGPLCELGAAVEATMPEVDAPAEAQAGGRAGAGVAVGAEAVEVEESNFVEGQKPMVPRTKKSSHDARGGKAGDGIVVRADTGVGGDAGVGGVVGHEA